MDIKLKQATLVECDDTTATVFLVVQKKNKTTEEIKVVAEKKEKETILTFFHDYWNSVEIDGVLYDLNLWHYDRGIFKATLYPTKKNGEFFETITNVFSGCKLKTIPLEEYEFMNS